MYFAFLTLTEIHYKCETDFIASKFDFLSLLLKSNNLYIYIKKNKQIKKKKKKNRKIN